MPTWQNITTESTPPARAAQVPSAGPLAAGADHHRVVRIVALLAACAVCVYLWFHTRKRSTSVSLFGNPSFAQINGTFLSMDGSSNGAARGRSERAAQRSIFKSEEQKPAQPPSGGTKKHSARGGTAPAPAELVQDASTNPIPPSGGDAFRSGEEKPQDLSGSIDNHLQIDQRVLVDDSTSEPVRGSSGTFSGPTGHPEGPTSHGLSQEASLASPPHHHALQPASFDSQEDRAFSPSQQVQHIQYFEL